MQSYFVWSTGITRSAEPPVTILEVLTLASLQTLNTAVFLGNMQKSGGSLNCFGTVSATSCVFKNNNPSSGVVFVAESAEIMLVKCEVPADQRTYKGSVAFTDCY